MIYSMDIEKSAGAVIFYIKDNEPYFLLLEYETYWGFVRGQIENGEEIEGTIIREAKEEANLSELKFIPGFKHVQQWFYKLKGQLRRKIATYLLAEITEKQAKEVRISFEHKSFKFLKLDEALGIMRIANEKKMLEKASEVIKENKKQKTLV
jgi:8-oxo-dGTP pyrophosphatase MutT (NUDIX family)